MKADDDGYNGLEGTYKDKETSSAVIAHGYGQVSEVPLKDLCNNTKNFLKLQNDPDAQS